MLLLEVMAIVAGVGTGVVPWGAGDSEAVGGLPSADLVGQLGDRPRRRGRGDAAFALVEVPAESQLILPSSPRPPRNLPQLIWAPH